MDSKTSGKTPKSSISQNFHKSMSYSPSYYCYSGSPLNTSTPSKSEETSNDQNVPKITRSSSFSNSGVSTSTKERVKETLNSAPDIRTLFKPQKERIIEHPKHSNNSEENLSKPQQAEETEKNAADPFDTIFNELSSLPTSPPVKPKKRNFIRTCTLL